MNGKQLQGTRRRRSQARGGTARTCIGMDALELPRELLLTSQDVRFYSHTICPLLPFQNKVSFFLTGPKPPLAALVLGRRFHPPERQRVAVCPRFAPSGGNGKGGEPESLLPQAESGPVSCRPRV